MHARTEPEDCLPTDSTASTHNASTFFLNFDHGYLKEENHGREENNKI